eukprot:CAMPEP_0206618516 /NCGR_PEP_ID=MMETSP0325_2-20121206/60298_1 /ASSEMBLY_ACC=CAM_ASM_000347 /TAXON_ID=2866 /ORGANISM="Crypthecodinium cohnii, Strain Seligo" /LENGTH=52 /DNA_ID=CAMNT_0054140747 /DNA_START=33 /DNA_END=188 /DNA_ORIENTATION=+
MSPASAKACTRGFELARRTLEVRSSTLFLTRRWQSASSDSGIPYKISLEDLV